MNNENIMKTYTGGCHCGAVRFSVEAETSLLIQSCNCSLCAMTAYLHLIVPASRFHLISGEQNLTTYTFNTGVAKHLFCKTCGIKSFYVPRSNPDGFSINARCIDKLDLSQLTIAAFNGQEWEAHGAALAHLSQA